VVGAFGWDFTRVVFLVVIARNVSSDEFIWFDRSHFLSPFVYHIKVNNEADFF
jgi:hypothetical protein